MRDNNSGDVSRRKYRVTTETGAELSSYVLYNRYGGWLGDILLEYSARNHSLIMSCVTDYGNYVHRWDGAGTEGYARFLLRVGNTYITDKMAYGHTEQRVLDSAQTQREIREDFEAENAGDDADWLGEALTELGCCESDTDFFLWAKTYDFADVQERFCYTWGGWLRGICTVVLPELMRLLKGEIEAEKSEE